MGLQEKKEDQEEQEIKDHDLLLQMVEAKDLVKFGENVSYEVKNI